MHNTTITLKGRANSDRLMINGIVLVMKDGAEHMVDRDKTEYSYDRETGDIRIDFVNPYIWDGENEDYDAGKISEYIRKAEYFLTDVEDDAPEGYEICLEDLIFTDEEGGALTLKHYGGAPDYRAYLGGASTYQIYQIRHDIDERHDIMFESLSDLKKRGYDVVRDNYAEVYRGVYGEDMTLEGLYEVFNCHRPEDFRGHSMSVSDVVVLTLEGRKMAYYCDAFGFTAVPQFLAGKEVA